MQEFFINVLKALVSQIIGVFGIFFLLGFLLSLIQNHTRKLYLNTVGWKGILWTSWIGTPIHEFGHLLFAKIFRHKITKVAIFQPNEETGELGSVDHSYNPRSLYQKVGNFFIGSAPMIFGSIFIWLMVYLLLPGGDKIYQTLFTSSDSLQSIFSSTVKMLIILFHPQNFSTWTYWLFLYITFAIASHLAPSQVDRKGMWQGFSWIILILFFVNIFSLALQLDPTTYILKINQYIGFFIAIFTYALIVSICHLLFSSVILGIFNHLAASNGR